MTADADRIEDVLIVGGGDAGLMTALSLEIENPALDVTLIDDFDESHRQVGKSTFASIVDILHNFLEIDQNRFFEEVQPVWKAGIHFEEWGGSSFYLPFDHEFYLREIDAPDFDVMTYRYRNEEIETLAVEMIKNRKTPFSPQGKGASFYNYIAYHLGTDRFNSFLESLCEERGVTLVNDRIEDVSVSGNRIDHVEGSTRQFEADLYVDATGFQRMLVGELDNSFTSFALPLDSAVVAKTSVRPTEIVPATVITAGEAGWFWQIDTTEYRDYGYVYSSNHLSQREATEEFRSDRGLGEETSVQHYEFESGMFDRAWVNNCLAVGDALGFVEPLESTALTLNGVLVRKLSQMLQRNGRFVSDWVRDTYNEVAWIAWTDVYEFIRLHYELVEGRNEFWTEMKRLHVEKTDYVEDILRHYRTQGMVTSTYRSGATNRGLRVINDSLYHELLLRMETPSEFYDTLDYAISEEDRSAIERTKEETRTRASNMASYADIAAPRR